MASSSSVLGTEAPRLKGLVRNLTTPLGDSFLTAHFTDDESEVTKLNT